MSPSYVRTDADISMVRSEESFPGLNCLANIFAIGENSEMTCQFIGPGG